MRELLRSLPKNERITHFFKQIAHLLIFWQKMRDLLGKPMSEFPALQKLDIYIIQYSCMPTRRNRLGFYVEIQIIFGAVQFTEKGHSDKTVGPSV